MKVGDLDLRELLDFAPGGGVLRFAGQRAVILDTVALGILRRELIESFGTTAARGVLTRFGFAHGWRTAETLKDALPWESELAWKRAGGRLHTLQGLVVFEPVVREPGAGPAPFAEAVWRESYEAEQHLLMLGRADEPVCWTLCGFASGYLSYSHGAEVYVVEERCVGRGDPVCRVVGKTREEWGDEITPHLPFFRDRCLDAALAGVTDALKRTERRLRARQQELVRSAGVSDVPAGWVARSEGMVRLLEMTRRVAKVDATVLVTGESGAGKERVAQLVHAESSRAGGPFVAIDCGAVAESLLESELFGHARGAFTGATQDRPGLFEAAHGGTLLLDEIGEIPTSMQVKLLRVLQEREVRRVGENRSRAVDVRLIAATNRDLALEVAAGRFRKDLLYRLRVVELKVPPLRERKEDLLALARLLLAEAGARLGRRVEGFSPRAADLLLRHSWPGNVRELANAVERAVVLATSSKVGPDDLPEELRLAPAPVAGGPGRALADVERDHILATLAAHHGNRARAAAALAIGPATLYRKLKQYEA